VAQDAAPAFTLEQGGMTVRCVSLAGLVAELGLAN
jgi:hypothetical protein